MLNSTKYSRSSQIPTFRLDFCQFLRRNTQGENKFMRRQLGNNNMPLVDCVAEKEPRLLRLMQIKVKDTDVCTILDLGTVADISFVEISRSLYILPTHSSKNIKIVKSGRLSYFGPLLKAPIIFGDKEIKLDYLLGRSCLSI